MIKYLRVKHFLDFIVALIALIVLMPLFITLALLIKLDNKGPVIFIQNRVGKNCRPFRMFKFRTMRVDSKQMVREDGTVITLKDDPRITRIGRFLRVGFDELPQLFNVLKGQMSIVGPRPDLPDQILSFTDHQLKKYQVKPGITNLPAISGRNELNFGQRIEIDINYIQRISFWLDMKIIFLTIFLLIGVYRVK